MRNMLNAVLLAVLCLSLCAAESGHPLHRRYRMHRNAPHQHVMNSQRQHLSPHVTNANQLSAERTLFDGYSARDIDGDVDEEEIEYEGAYDHFEDAQYDEDQYGANQYDDAQYDGDESGAHVVISKEGPPPAPQEYTISKLEEAVVCADRGDATWAKWKKYDLDGVCSRLQYYGEIEGRCETDCDALCPNGFYEVAKEPCTGVNHFAVHSEVGIHSHTVHAQSGYYRQCVGRYQCTHSNYNYWVNMKWWQFLLWEVAIVIIGCCFCGLAVGCCLRCTHGDRYRRNNGPWPYWRGGNNGRRRAPQNGNARRNQQQQGGGGVQSGGQASQQRSQRQQNQQIPPQRAQQPLASPNGGIPRGHGNQ